MEDLNYKNENIERKYFKNMRKNQALKVKKSLLVLKKIFYRNIENLKIERQK